MAEAIGQYRNAVQAAPGNVDAALHLARALVKTQALEEAARVLDAALQHQPRDAALHFERGKLLASAGEREAALQQLKIAIQLNPKPPNRIWS
jgi:tetratricopeptide (TPR) repeat protein